MLSRGPMFAALRLKCLSLRFICCCRTASNSRQLSTATTDQLAENRPTNRPLVKALPGSVVTLFADEGSVVHLVGTVHISQRSPDDVVKTIHLTKPDYVMLELCPPRLSNMSAVAEVFALGGVRAAAEKMSKLNPYRYSALRTGLMPGAEFLQGLKESEKVPGCSSITGDRDFITTLKRLRHLVPFKELLGLRKISSHLQKGMRANAASGKKAGSREQVMQSVAFLDSLLSLESTKKFLMDPFRENCPTIYQVMVTERDAILRHSLQQLAKPIRSGRPVVVVGVVGRGHIPGIMRDWNKPVTYDTILEYTRTPAKTKWRHSLFNWVQTFGQGKELQK